jgi:ankyrin repeat protein
VLTILYVSCLPLSLQLAVTDHGLEHELSALDQSGYSLLHYACLYGLVTLVPLLLARGAAVDAPTGCGRAHTPLHLAAAAGSLEVRLVMYTYFAAAS